MKGDELCLIRFRGIEFEGITDDDPPRNTPVMLFNEPAIFEAYDAAIVDEEEYESWFGPIVTHDPEALIQIVDVNEPGEAQDCFLELIGIANGRRSEEDYDEFDCEEDDDI